MGRKKALRIDQVATPAGAAKIIGVPRTTLDSAVTIGLVESATLACGRQVVVLESARQWATSERRREYTPRGAKSA